MKIKNIINKLIINTNKFQSNFEYKAEQLTNFTLNSNISGISQENYSSNEVIVSLTTYGRRFYEVYLAIESIMQQSLKPNKIILWISEDYKNIKLPLTLKLQKERGLEINYCKDILSYKKLIPSLKLFPEAIIITIDDDCLYHFDLIENLVIAYKNEPDLIHSARIHRMKLIKKNKFEKYRKWIRNYQNFDISPLNFPTGGAGTLYPPHCFNEEIFNENIFLEICKYADDVWFKAMSLLKGTMSKKVFTHNKNGKDYISNENNQDIGLARLNLAKNMNDIQIKSVFDRYDLYNKLNLF